MPSHEPGLRPSGQQQGLDLGVDQRLHFRVKVDSHTRIQQDTGLYPDRLAAMTFIGLDPDLASAALKHNTPCPACTAAAVTSGGRPVSLLGARAAWRVACPMHPSFPRPEEISVGVDLAPIHVRIREILSILDRSAFDPEILEDYMPEIRPAVTAGTAVHFAYLLNSFLQVRLETYDTLRDVAVFQVVRTYEPVYHGQPTPLLVDARNDRALSMLLAWQLLAQPIWSLLVGLRMQALPERANMDPHSTKRRFRPAAARLARRVAEHAYPWARK